MKKKLLSKKRIFLFIITVALLMTFLNPLARSTEAIKIDILEHTPVGSTNEEVIKFIEKKYKNKRITRYVDKEITVIIGEYRDFRDFIFMTSVEVVWHFDEKGCLERVSARKYTDSI